MFPTPSLTHRRDMTLVLHPLLSMRAVSVINLFLIASFLLLPSQGYYVLEQGKHQSTETCEPLSTNREGWTRAVVVVTAVSQQIVSLFELQSNDSKAGHPKEPRFQGHDGIGWFYSFNPCTDFGKFQNEVKKYPGYRPCKQVAAARWTDESTHRCDGLGEQNHGEFLSWSNDDLDNLTVSNLTLTFRNVTTKYGMQISLVCNRGISTNQTTFSYLGTLNKPYSTYYFKLESICCCPGGCKSGYHPPSGKKHEYYYIIGIVAGILVLVLLVALAVYLIRKHQHNQHYPTDDSREPLVTNA